MREVEVSRLTDVIEKLCIEANEHLPKDVKDAITTCRACEDGEIAKGVLDDIIKNFDIADQECVPICQDTFPNPCLRFSIRPIPVSSSSSLMDLMALFLPQFSNSIISSMEK